jgi:hypothetical protein
VCLCFVAIGDHLPISNAQRLRVHSHRLLFSPARLHHICFGEMQLPQLIANYRRKSTGQLSVVPWVFNLLGSVSTGSHPHLPHP